MGALALYQDDTQLEDILLDENPNENRESFVIDSIEKAAWAAKKFIEAQKRVEERVIQNGDFKAKIDLWAERANAEDISTLEFMKGVLEPYAKKMVTAQKRSKSLKLPEAMVSFRQSPTTVEVVNEDLAISFCESNHPEAIETKKFLLKNELKKILAGGLVIPGVGLLPGRKQMYIKKMKEKAKI